MNDPGHNSGTAQGSELRGYIDRIERLEAEKRDLQSDIKDIYAEAKVAGFDTKAMRKLIAERRMDEAQREALAETLDQYREALGMLASTALGQAALKREGIDVTVEPAAAE